MWQVLPEWSLCMTNCHTPVIHNCHTQTVTVTTLFSDHHAVEFEMRLSKPGAVKQQIHYSQLRRINHTQLRRDLEQLSVVTHPAVSLTTLVKQYNTDLSELLERHAPLKSRFLTLRPFSPWYDADLIAAKQKRRRSELRWRRSVLTVHRQMYIEQRQAVARLLKAKKSQYYSNQVKENASDPKMIFGLVDKLLQKKTETSLLQHSSLDDLVEDFSSFFVNKIQGLRQQLSSCPLESTVAVPDLVSRRTTATQPLSCFRHVDDSEVLKVVSASSPKSCSLDPLLTTILKANIDVLLPALTRIINHSITSGCFPSAFKGAHVMPLLKKSSLDRDTMKNYRPISNLPFVSKVVERVVASQLNAHMLEHSLLEPAQSAYRRNHSTESALLRVRSDVLQAIDGKKCVVLVLLDLSAAFDTIDHEILLLRLEIDIGVCGFALAWFRSYLSGRTQSVRIHNTTSQPQPLHYGVPQGSVLGPVLFTVYSAPIAAIARQHGLSVQL